MGDKKMWIMVGLPMSGKTTEVKKLIEEYGGAVVNPDAVRLAMHGQAYVQDSEDFVWATVRCMVRALYLSGHGLVIIDACNTSKKRRDAWRYLVKDVEISFIVIKEDVDVCLSRTDSKDLRIAIERMAISAEPVMKDEGKILNEPKD